MKIGAFFDVDGTLYTAHMWHGLMRYAAENGHALQVRAYYAGLLPLFALRRLRLIREEDFRRPWILRLGWLLRGWSLAEGEAALRWVADQYIRPTAREDIITCLRQHVDAGHVVILVSGMLAPTLRFLGESLGVTGTVGTEVEIRDGRFTGGVIPPACLGIEKDRLTRKFLHDHGIDVDLAASHAYADSISDLALFEMVGHPVAVYPDKQLAALARERRWEIRGEPREH